MEYYAQIVGLGVRDHDEFQRRWRFIVMQLIVTSPIRDEAWTAISLQDGR